MAPFSLALIGVFLIPNIRRILEKPFATFLAIQTLAYLGLFCVVKIGQGMANDWDVLAPYFYIIGLFSIVLFEGWADRDRYRAASLILSMTVVHSALFFVLNSTIEPKIRRIQSLFDSSMISQLGQYTISLHLSRYYDAVGDSTHQQLLWARYSTFFPNDPRGYARRIEYLKRLSVPDEDTILAAYKLWFEQDPTNEQLRREFASRLLKVGNAEFAKGEMERARGAYERVVILEQGSAVAYNNLGSIFAEMGRPDSALTLFRRALVLDSNYADAYFNLGLAYNDVGDEERAIQAMKRADALGNDRAGDFLKRERGRRNR
jgi:tetratricopeptide (TPR) repeat protein